MAPVPFGDYPDEFIRVGFVAAENPEAFLNTQLVFLAVVLREFSPIARDVAREEVHRTLAALFESREGSRSSDELSEVEQGFTFGLLHGDSPALEFEVASKARRSRA